MEFQFLARNIYPPLVGKEFVGVGFPDPFGFGREDPAPTIRAKSRQAGVSWTPRLKLTNLVFCFTIDYSRIY